MSKDNVKKRGVGWFKPNSPSPNHADENNIQLQAVTTEITDHEQFGDVVELEQSSASLFSKDNQDKIVLDMIVSLESMLKERQLILYKTKGLEEQLYTANEIINRLKQEQMKKEQILQEKNKEIRTLETNLTNKQMSYDQLLEDYKEYQTTSNIEYEKTSNLLEIESNKYNKLNQEATNAQYQNMLKTNELEEKIRNLEIENQGYIKEYQKALDDKAALMQTINDFTERMSFSFSPKTTTTHVSD